MKLKLLLHIVSTVVMVGCLTSILSCNRISSDSRKADMDTFLFNLAASMGDDSKGVNRKVDSLIQITSDSFLYYRCLLLKSKAAFYEGKFDTSILMLKQVEVFGNKWMEDRRVLPIWADFYNMRGNLFGRKAQIDSMIWAFEKSYHYVQQSGTARLMPDICLNLGMLMCATADMTGELPGIGVVCSLWILCNCRIMPVFRLITDWHR